MQKRIRRDRGSVMMVIIVFLLVITVGLACGNIVVYARLQSLEDERAQLQEEIKEADARNKAIHVIIKDAIVPVRKEYDKFFEEAKDPAKLPTNAEKEQKDEKRDKFFYDALKDTPVVKDGTKLLDTYQEIIPEAAARIHSSRIHTVDAEHKVIIAKDRAESVKGTEKKISDIQEQTIGDLKAERSRVAQKVQEVDAAAARIVEDLKVKIAKIDEQTAKEKESHQQKMGEYDGEEKNLKNEIKHPKVTRTVSWAMEHPIFKVHGKVLEVDPRNKTGYIDIGSDQRVVKGMRFGVAKPGLRNGYVLKGAVEVKKVWENRCEVEINAFDPTNTPVIKDDLLINPLFDTRRPLIVAFLVDARILTKMPEMTRSVEEYKRRLMEIGSRPTTAIDVHTDYALVIAGLTADGRKVELEEFVKTSPEFRKVEELNVPFFTEAPEQEIKVTDLLWYLEFLYGR